MKTCGGRIMGVVLLVVLALASGCTYVQRGAAIGAGGGAVVGGVLASTQGILSAGEGAAVGAAAGGLAGALTGDQFRAKKAEELKAEVENLKAQIEAKEELASKKDSDLQKLQAELDEKEQQLNQQLSKIAQMNKDLSQKDQQLAQVKRDYEQKLSEVQSMEDKLRELEVKLQQTPEGLELTILNELLFASGSDEITSKGRTLLNQVAEIIREHFPNKQIMVEGHTDNQEIQYSGWKSNWELGAHRALSVLHFMVDNQDFNPERMSAVTYSKYRAVADNATEEGRQQNRRAVIMILPEVEREYKKFMEE